jgi:hypothetical protein
LGTVCTVVKKLDRAVGEVQLIEQVYWHDHVINRVESWRISLKARKKKISKVPGLCGSCDCRFD